jgi:hypothetical protein
MGMRGASRADADGTWTGETRAKAGHRPGQGQRRERAYWLAVELHGPWRPVKEPGGSQGDSQSALDASKKGAGGTGERRKPSRVRVRDPGIQR